MGRAGRNALMTTVLRLVTGGGQVSHLHQEPLRRGRACDRAQAWPETQPTKGASQDLCLGSSQLCRLCWVLKGGSGREEEKV